MKSRVLRKNIPLSIEIRPKNQRGGKNRITLTALLALVSTTLLLNSRLIQTAKIVVAVSEIFVCLHVFARTNAPSERKDATVRKRIVGPQAALVFGTMRSVTLNFAKTAFARAMCATTIKS